MNDQTKTLLKAFATALYGLFALPTPLRALIALSILTVSSNVLQGWLAIRRGERWDWAKYLRGTVGSLTTYWLIFFSLSLGGGQLAEFALQGGFFVFALIEIYLLVEAAVELGLMPKLLLNFFRKKLSEQGVVSEAESGGKDGQ